MHHHVEIYNQEAQQKKFRQINYLHRPAAQPHHVGTFQRVPVVKPRIGTSRFLYLGRGESVVGEARGRVDGPEAP